MAFSFIVPLSFACGSDCEHLRQLVYRNFGCLCASHYSIRPAKVFQNVDQRVTIFTAMHKGVQPCDVRSSRLYRFTEAQKNMLITTPVMGIVGPVSQGFIPRIADNIGAAIYHKFLSITTTIGDYRTTADDMPYTWYYHNIGRYWLKAYNFKPFFTRGGLPVTSSGTNAVEVKSSTIAKICIAIVNSSLFYFWWMTRSDEFHLLASEVFSMPFVEGLLGNVTLPSVVDRLMDDYKAKAHRKTLRLKNGTIIEMDEIHARESRNIILEIDNILAPYYGLTNEELLFLQDYDKEFRCGD